MNDLINISVGDAAMTALLGYAVVFIGIIMLMILVMFVGDLMFKSAKRKAAKAPAAAPATPAAPAAPAAAPGTAGELKLYDTDPRDAAMVMAIVADKLGKPLNELRFKSIREVKDK